MEFRATLNFRINRALSSPNGCLSALRNMRNKIRKWLPTKWYNVATDWRLYKLQNGFHSVRAKAKAVGNFCFYRNVDRVYIGTLRKTRRQRQRERHQTIGLSRKTITVHVRYNSWYISLPSSAKQRRETTKFCVVWRNDIFRALPQCKNLWNSPAM